MKRSLRLAFGLFISGLLIPLSAARAMTELNPEGPYKQAATGMIFPVSIGDFRRINIIRYDEDGTDESAGYNREIPMSEISATVYLFPSPGLSSFGSSQNIIDDTRSRLCVQQFQAIQREVSGAHPDAKLISEGTARLVQGADIHIGYQAFYTLTNPLFFDRRDVASRSDVYVFCFVGGKWTVEYRIDYPQDYDASKEIADFMRELVWTIPAENN